MLGIITMEKKNPFWSEGIPGREITLGTDEGSLLTLTDFICAHAWEAGFEDSRIEEIRNASYLAMKNIAENAYQNKGGEISVECSVTDAGFLIVIITDYGRPYNMLLSDIEPYPAEEGRKRDESVRLIKKLIKNVEYRRDASRNVLIFTISKPLF